MPRVVRRHDAVNTFTAVGASANSSMTARSVSDISNFANRNDSCGAAFAKTAETPRAARANNGTRSASRVSHSSVASKSPMRAETPISPAPETMAAARTRSGIACAAARAYGPPPE
jgi:hypothetical protein